MSAKRTSECEVSGLGGKVATKARGLIAHHTEVTKKRKELSRVGGGVCWEFVDAALKQAGAMSWHQLNPGKQAGTTLSDQLHKGTWGKEKNPLDARVGDVVLLSGYRYDEPIVDPGAKGTVTLVHIPNGVGHVGIVVGTKGEDKWLIAEQNNPTGRGPRKCWYPRVFNAKVLRVFSPTPAACPPAVMGASAGQPRVNANKKDIKPPGRQATAPSSMPQS